MQFTQSGLLLSFEVTFSDATLPVAMQVFNDSGGSPVLLDTIPMLNFFGTSYRAQYTPTPGSYLIHKAVYMDTSYTTLDPTYLAGTEAIVAQDMAGLVLNATMSSYLEDGSVGKTIDMGGGGSGAGTITPGLPIQAVMKIQPVLKAVIQLPMIR